MKFDPKTAKFFLDPGSKTTGRISPLYLIRRDILHGMQKSTQFHEVALGPAWFSIAILVGVGFEMLVRYFSKPTEQDFFKKQLAPSDYELFRNKVLSDKLSKEEIYLLTKLRDAFAHFYMPIATISRSKKQSSDYPDISLLNRFGRNCQFAWVYYSLESDDSKVPIIKIDGIKKEERRIIVTVQIDKLAKYFEGVCKKARGCLLDQNNHLVDDLRRNFDINLRMDKEEKHFVGIWPKLKNMRT